MYLFSHLRPGPLGGVNRDDLIKDSTDTTACNRGLSILRSWNTSVCSSAQEVATSHEPAQEGSTKSTTCGWTFIRMSKIKNVCTFRCVHVNKWLWLLVRQEVFDLWPYRQETNSHPDQPKNYPNPNLTARLGSIRQRESRRGATEREQPQRESKHEATEREQAMSEPPADSGVGVWPQLSPYQIVFKVSVSCKMPNTDNLPRPVGCLPVTNVYSACLPSSPCLPACPHHLLRPPVRCPATGLRRVCLPPPPTLPACSPSPPPVFAVPACLPAPTAYSACLFACPTVRLQCACLPAGLYRPPVHLPPPPK